MCFTLKKLKISEVSDFGPYAHIENSEISETFSILVNLKECVLLEEVGNFWGFPVFDFGPYTEIENSEILSTLVSKFLRLCFLLEEVGNFWGFRIFNFGHYAEIENSENSEIFSRLINF